VRSNPKGRQAKSKARLARFEELQSQEFQSRNETNEIYIPPGPRLGDKVIEAGACARPSATGCCSTTVSFNRAQGQHRRHHRRQRHGQVHPVPHDHRRRSSRTAAASKVGETVKLAYVDQSRDDLAGDKTVWEEISDGLDNINIGKLRGQLALLRRTLQLQGLGPAEIRQGPVRR
jgi:sulfate-transporting ATPase